MKLPKITIRTPAPNYPDNLEVDIEWEGEYTSMLTFHKSDFESEEGLARAKKIIDAHVGMVNRTIQLEWLKEKISLGLTVHAK